MSHFPCTYIGNKFKEFDKHYYEFINLKDKTTIIEPFGGSLAMMFQIYRKNKDKDFKYIANDISPMTYAIYKMLKEMKVEEIEKKVQDVIEIVKDKTKWDALKKEKELTEVCYYIVYNKYYNYRPGLYPTTRKTNWVYKFTPLQLEFYEFINNPNVEINNKDWRDIFNEHKDDKSAVFLFDPPYMFSDNSFYDMDSATRYKENVYEYFAINNDVKFNADIYFMLELNWIIKLLFKSHDIILECDKRYDISKRKTTHGLIKFKN
jgi:hypothetical protein